VLEDVEERIREKAGTYFSTLKYGTGPFRPSDEGAIDQSRFQLLWPKTKDKRIHKIRYHIPYGHSLVELDVFQGDKRGLMVAEVGFRTQEEADAFVPPDWFGEEVTHDVGYTNYELASPLYDHQNNF
jgi:CYTH domain-containing protein